MKKILLTICILIACANMAFGQVTISTSDLIGTKWQLLENYESHSSAYYELSKEYGLAHESSPNNPAEEKEMDLYNNEIGFEIGQTAKQNGHSKESIQSLVAAAINQGRGKVIK